MGLSRTSDGTLNDIIKILIALIFPPISVFIETGLGKQFIINVLLTIIGFLPGVVHAVYIVSTR